MGDLDIEIKVAVQNALAELNRAEQAANKAEKAFDGFAATFARIAAHEQRMAQEMAKARGVVDNLSGSFGKLAQALRAEQLNATARAFGGLTQQLEREHAMLERIHGPAKQMQQDLQTLEMLHRRGAITAAEYTEQLHKMGAVQGPSASQAGKAGGGLMDRALGVLGGAAGTVGGVGAAGAMIAEEAARFRRHEEETVNATNALIKFYGTYDDASEHIGKFRDLSNDLNAKLGDAVKAYDAVEGATQSLYLTQQQQLDITRNLGQALVVDGDSLEALTPIMERLEFMISKNAVSSGELQKIIRQYPQVAEAWRDEFKMTTAELLRAADSGELTRLGLGRLVTTFQNSGDAAAKFAERQYTLGQVMEMTDEGIMGAALKFVQWKQAAEQASDTSISVEEGIARLALQFKRLQDRIDDANAAVRTSAAISALAFGGAALAEANRDLAIQREEMEKIRGPQQEYHRRVDNLNAMLRAEKIDQVEFNRRLNELNGTHRTAARAVTEHAEALKELRNVMLSMDDASKIARGMGIRSAATGKYEDFEGARGLGASAGEQSLVSGSTSVFDSLFKGAKEDGAAVLGVFEAMGQRLNEAAEAARNLTKEQEAFAEAFKTIGTSLGDQLVDAANGAGQSWAEWGESTLDWIQKAITRALILKAITGDYSGARGEAGYGGILGALGFAHGGTYIGGVGAVYGGAWANGGTWYAPQTGGGQDTIPVLSMVSPGERIDYTPSGQQPHGQAQSAAPAVVQVVNQPVDDRALLQAFSTASGRQVFHNLVRQNRSTIKALLD